MKLVINDQQNIAEVKQEFNKVFPYLKLEFYSKKHPPGRPSSLKFVAKDDVILADHKIEEGTDNMVVTPEMSVNEFEQGFSKIYDLGVQVFRQSGSLWYETVLTDDWTLERQNAEGKSKSSPYW